MLVGWQKNPGAFCKGASEGKGGKQRAVAQGCSGASQLLSAVFANALAPVGTPGPPWVWAGSLWVSADGKRLFSLPASYLYGPFCVTMDFQLDF